MAVCENCGNDYDKAFEVRTNGRTYTFDSFECAINVLAPTCRHCNTRILGHGVEQDGMMFCCANCAQQEGKTGVCDRGEAA
ncbi:MAG TPA: hypothetical protein VE631_08530 [Alphaproteobacteria bacterium]|nr:hypothetical protein [Alphaproteobacteria bacterium]